MLHLEQGAYLFLLWFSCVWAEIERQVLDLCGNRKQGCCSMVKCMEKKCEFDYLFGLKDLSIEGLFRYAGPLLGRISSLFLSKPK